MAFQRGRGIDLGAALTTDKSRAFGDYTLACNGRIVRPAWENGYTVVRFLPGIDPDDTSKFTACHLGNSPGSFDEWLITTHSVKRVGIGDDVRSFNIAPEYGMDYDDCQGAPYVILYNGLSRAEKNGTIRPDWAKLLRGGKGLSPAIPQPRQIFYAPCLVYYNGDKVLNPLDSVQRMTIMAMPTSAGRALLGLFIDDWNAAADQNTDPIDIVSFDKGAFVTFWNSERPDPHSTDVYTRTDQNSFKVYKASFDKRYPYQHARYRDLPDATLPDAVIEAYRKVAVPMRKALNFMDYEQQADLVSQVIPAEILAYCWENHPEWLPRKLRIQAANASVQGPTQYYATASAPNTQTQAGPKDEYNRKHLNVVVGPDLKPVSDMHDQTQPPQQQPMSQADMYSQFAQEIKMEADEDGGINWGLDVKDPNELPY